MCHTKNFNNITINTKYKITIEKFFKKFKNLTDCLILKSGEQNSTGAAIKNVQGINSNPSSCGDIRMLSYTGYYLVNSSDSARRFGIAFCQFKLPPGLLKGIKRHEELLKFSLNWFLIMNL